MKSVLETDIFEDDKNALGMSFILVSSGIWSKAGRWCNLTSAMCSNFRLAMNASRLIHSRTLTMDSVWLLENKNQTLCTGITDRIEKNQSKSISSSIACFVWLGEVAIMITVIKSFFCYQRAFSVPLHHFPIINKARHKKRKKKRSLFCSYFS